MNDLIGFNKCAAKKSREAIHFIFTGIQSFLIGVQTDLKAIKKRNIQSTEPTDFPNSLFPYFPLSQISFFFFFFFFFGFFLFVQSLENFL